MAADQRKEREELDREIERYRKAATTTLDQLAWTVDYLNKIHKRRIARALDNNRKLIMKRMRGG